MRTVEPSSSGPKVPDALAATVERKRFLRFPTAKSLWLVCFGGIAALVATGGAMWWLATTQLQDAVENWVAARRADGYTVSYNSVSSGGTPWEPTLDIEAPTIISPAGATTWALSGERLMIAIKVPRLDRPDIRLVGEHLVELAAAERRLAASIVAADMVVIPDLTSAEGEGALYARDFRITRPTGQLVATGRFLHAVLIRNSPHADDGEYTLDLSAQDIETPLIVASFPLGTKIEHVAATGRTRGGLPRKPWPAGLLDWQAAGGAFELENFNAVYGPLTIGASGTFAVDAQAQPVGNVTAHASGMREAVDALYDKGWVTHRQALYTRLAVKTMARYPPDGGPPVVSVPLVIQQQRIFVGPFEIGKVPQVHWNGMGVDPHKISGAGS